MVHCNSRSALQRTVTSFVIAAWPANLEKLVDSKAVNGKEVNGKCCPTVVPKNHEGLSKRLLDCLNESVYFDEIALGFSKLQSESKDFVATLKHYKVPLREDLENLPPTHFFTFEQIEMLTSNIIIEGIQRAIKKNKVVDTLMERRKTIHNICATTTYELASLNTL